MALATAKAAPLRPVVKLSQALNDYESILSAEQRQSYKRSPPDANAVMALTCEINRQNASRRTRRCGARLTSFLNSVKGFTSIVDLIISSSGNPIAAGIWGAVKIAVQTASGFETYFDSLSIMLMNIGLGSPRFEKYALLYPTSISLQKELCNYYSIVVNLCTRIILFMRKPFIRQFASALRKPFDDEFGTFQKDLIRLGTAVNEEVSLASKQQQSLDSVEEARERKENSRFRLTGTVFRREIASELDQARKWRESRAKSRFLNSCSRYNYETSLTQARKKGESTWIFKYDEYHQWISSNSPSTLLCSGIVGAGKTVLCANVVEELILNKSQGSSIGYFFCRSDEAASLKAREVIGSLVRQFFEDVPNAEFRFTEMDPSLGGITLDTERMLSNMLFLLPRHKHYVMVIDGLDECEYDEVRALVESVQSLLKSSKHIHILPSNNGPEISRFIQLALEDALESNRLKLRDPNIVLKIQDALELGANEMFLWVAFQIDSICAQNTDHDIIKSLEDLPKGLPATFRRILRRLQHTAFADPDLGRKIFEIVAAAQRPLTLDELGEAVSITPGDTVWDRNKSIIDILKSLESCGSFIVVDEELSTVHFAHSSVKRHLLSEPTDLDVRDYHIDPLRADINLGRIAVTYLNLDVLGSQLSKTSGSSQKYAANVPSFVLRSALPKRHVVNKMALAVLRGRKMRGNDSGPNLERSANFLSENNTQMQEVFSLLTYCQEYWLYHSKSFLDSKVDPVYELWNRLLNGEVRVVELPWAPEYLFDLGEKFRDWITKSRHDALTRRAIHKVWFWHYYNPTFFDIDLLALLLSLLPDEDAFRNLDLKPKQRDNALLVDAASRGYEIVVRLVLQEGADINTLDAAYGNALHAAISSSNKTSTSNKRIAELLIKKGADVNGQGGRYGTALQAGAATHGMDPIVKLLLEKGADVNACGGEHGTALAAAARIDNIAALRLLLEAGADVNSCDGQDRTALITAVAYSNLHAFSILLDTSTDINYSSLKGESPLRVATKTQYEYIVRKLLDNGALVDVALENEQEYMEVFNTNKLIARLLYRAFTANSV